MAVRYALLIFGSEELSSHYYASAAHVLKAIGHASAKWLRSDACSAGAWVLSLTEVSIVHQPAP